MPAMANMEGLHQIARQASWLLEQGNIPGSDRLRMLLEMYNCCVICGTMQIPNRDLERWFGEWVCPKCDYYNRGEKC